MKHFSSTFVKQHTHNRARTLHVVTAHGEFNTPTFMPVATRAFVNLMSPEQLHTAGSQIILGGNTYHMLCTPGMEVIRQAGGMHQFMNWHGPMLTDSGGFQVHSLSKNKKLCRIDEHGAHFRHPRTHETIYMTPTVSLETQKIIGADIIMAFDQCTPDIDDKPLVQSIMEKTHRWLRESKDYHDQHPQSIYGYQQALFGIIQGGFFQDLRLESTQFVVDMALDGIAIGGESIGFDMKKTVEIVNWIHDLLPKQKVRYTMGVGLHPQDLIDVAAAGIDIFDCVAPTRNARHGSLYCGEIIKEDNWVKFVDSAPRGRINIKKSIYALDDKPIMENCECHTCQHYSRSYLHYLFKEKFVVFSNLACTHNIHVMHAVCAAMRECILN
ncbi:MAG: tRNA guanosine(34) transglycosylase Tgt [Gammaproteobacteria bacterium]|nr:tRNA guanosine(34) transglycosylase Tgt [Gammaproteobacteria bacterium]